MTKTIPNFIYGTAWKKEATTKLVESALQAGFCAIDTANQLKHYDEKRVGDALKNCRVARNELWLQSKFTSLDGQDHRLPYDKNSDLATQVRQSFASSLEHLHTDYLDSYLLHGPLNFPHLGDEDFVIWEVLEELYESGQTKAIGISNVNRNQIEMLFARAKTKPHFVQNRCYANRGWDKDVREFCLKNNIAYQGFSLLTANPQIVQSRAVAELATKYKVEPEQIIFRFCKQIGILPLTGTSDENHMRADLKIANFELAENEIKIIQTL